MIFHMKTMSEYSDFEKNIVSKLDIIIKLMGKKMLDEYKTNKDKILFLNSLGLEPNEIITLSDIPRKTVYNVLSEARKQENEE